MNDVQSLVLATLKEIRNALVDNACTAVELNPDQNIEQFPRADLEQMVEGTFIAIKEFYEGGERRFWNDYLETVIPGILAVGFQLPQVLHTVSSFFALCITDLDRKLANNPLRNDARVEFARFASAWQQAIMRVSVA